MGGRGERSDRRDGGNVEAIAGPELAPGLTSAPARQNPGGKSHDQFFPPLPADGGPRDTESGNWFASATMAIGVIDSLSGNPLGEARRTPGVQPSRTQCARSMPSDGLPRRVGTRDDGQYGTRHLALRRARCPPRAYPSLATGGLPSSPWVLASLPTLRGFRVIMIARSAPEGGRDAFSTDEHVPIRL